MSFTYYICPYCRVATYNSYLGREYRFCGSCGFLLLLRLFLSGHCSIGCFPIILTLLIPLQKGCIQRWSLHCCHRLFCRCFLSLLRCLFHSSVKSPIGYTCSHCQKTKAAANGNGLHAFCFFLFFHFNSTSDAIVALCIGFYAICLKVIPV